MHFLNQRAGDLPRHAVTLSRQHWGVGDKPVRYVIVIVRPTHDPQKWAPAFGFRSCERKSWPSEQPGNQRSNKLFWS
jgi:hypothetical protein